MRRHRMNHFDEEGYLTHKGKKLYATYNRTLGKEPDDVTLADFEENFEPLDDDTGTVPQRDTDIIYMYIVHVHTRATCHALSSDRSLRAATVAAVEPKNVLLQQNEHGLLVYRQTATSMDEYNDRHMAARRMRMK